MRERETQKIFVAELVAETSWRSARSGTELIYRRCFLGGQRQSFICSDRCFTALRADFSHVPTIAPRLAGLARADPAQRRIGNREDVPVFGCS